jgi:hypothetical protein
VAGCCNLRWAIRDFTLDVLSLEGKRNVISGLRTTARGFAKRQMKKGESHTLAFAEIILI